LTENRENTLKTPKIEGIRGDDGYVRLSDDSLMKVTNLGKVLKMIEEIQNEK
jgi:hypothetical protein